ncbi:MAG: hypothetical protein KJS97_03100 [Alphaproteobacteria bacterium]|nr:hypothetical protein [Alphaproteobacteria bacterium]
MSETSDPQAPQTPAAAPPARLGMGRIWFAIYAAIALVFAGAAAYMHIVQKAPLMQPQVLFPSLGAVWFVIRAALALRAPTGGSHARG